MKATWSQQLADETILAQLWVTTDDGAWMSSSDFPEASGGNPLVLEWDITEFAGHRFGITFHVMTRADASVATAMVFQERSFSLEGGLRLEYAGST